MPATEPQRTPEELARLGSEIYERRVRPMLRPEDDDKFAAIDVQTGDYEVDEDDYAAVSRLHAPQPGSRRLAHSGRTTGGLPDRIRRD